MGRGLVLWPRSWDPRLKDKGMEDDDRPRVCAAETCPYFSWRWDLK